MKKRLEDLEVLQNLRLNTNHVVLTLRLLAPFPALQPGQFVEALVKGSPSTYLRRPLSIHDADRSTSTLSLLIKEVGDGTRHLAALQAGDVLNLVYPLGKGFSMPESGPVLLIGGGCGVAPLLFLARTLAEKSIQIEILIGGSTARDIMRPDEYRQYGPLHITTEDGSVGIKGKVTDHPVFRDQLSQYKMVYTCGPDGMMRAVAAGTSVAEVPCEVSLENTMACGIGACLCCVTQTTQGNRCVCIDGPVFNTRDLLWLISV